MWVNCVMQIKNVRKRSSGEYNSANPHTPVCVLRAKRKTTVDCMRCSKCVWCWTGLKAACAIWDSLSCLFLVNLCVFSLSCPGVKTLEDTQIHCCQDGGIKLEVERRGDNFITLYPSQQRMFYVIVKLIYDLLLFKISIFWCIFIV